jgi:hypothetical protein
VYQTRKQLQANEIKTRDRDVGSCVEHGRPKKLDDHEELASTLEPLLDGFPRRTTAIAISLAALDVVGYVAMSKDQVHEVLMPVKDDLRARYALTKKQKYHDYVGIFCDRCIWGEKDEPSWSEERRRLESRRVAKSGLALVTERPSVGMKRRIEKDSLSFLILAMERKTKRKDRSNGKAYA